MSDDDLLTRLAGIAERARAAGADDLAARALDLARAVAVQRRPVRPVDTRVPLDTDQIDPRQPTDPPWRSRHAHRSLAPAVAAMLLRARIAWGWTQVEAAERCDVARRMIGMLEAGQRVPSRAMAEALITGYGLDSRDAELLRQVALPGVGRDSPYHPG